MLMHMTLIKFPRESQCGQYRSFRAESDHVKFTIKATINELDCTYIDRVIQIPPLVQLSLTPLLHRYIQQILEIFQNPCTILK